MSNPETPVEPSNNPETSLKEITEQLASMRERLEESLIPVKTTSFNGCGIMLLDYRAVEDGNYEATRWITACALPLIPLSVWKITPKKYNYDRSGEQQTFCLVAKSRLTITRILFPYLVVAIGVLPFVLAYFFADLNPVLQIIRKTIGDWAVVGFIILLIILVLIWIGFIFTRMHNAEKAYK